uniref:HTH marR-type domain-containing protein n=1 Tax=Eubacterium plexicaudatum ASF492 TaxID=1235802 RepID=N1ZXI5_9FIRM
MMLTERGVLAYRHHERFHQDMIAFILEHVSEDESMVLQKALERMMGYFRQKYDPL